MTGRPALADVGIAKMVVRFIVDGRNMLALVGGRTYTETRKDTELRTAVPDRNSVHPLPAERFHLKA